MKSQIIKFDVLLLVIVLLLSVIGTAAIYSASSYIAMEEQGNSQYFLGKQLFRLALGIILMLLFIKIDYHILQNISPAIVVGSFFLLIYVMFNGITINGSKRFFLINGISFQPSEVAKLALIIFLSTYLIDQQKKIKDFNEGLLPILAIIFIVIFPILLEPDLGTATIIFSICILMIFIAGASLYHLSGLGALAAVAVSLFLKIFPYQKLRVVNYINAIRGVADPPYQIRQSLISFGNGGFFGVGIGNSRQKMHFLPHPFNDFIYSIIGEEAGFIGCIIILILFLLLLWRGLWIATHAPDKKGQLLAIGIIVSITTYAFFNAGIALNLLPVTGITMPFISYGGSSMIVNFIGMGILLNISLQNRSSKKGGRSVQSSNRVKRSKVKYKKKRTS